MVQAKIANQRTLLMRSLRAKSQDDDASVRGSDEPAAVEMARILARLDEAPIPVSSSGLKDIMEEFRAVIVDSVVLTLVNNGMLTASDFVQWNGPISAAPKAAAPLKSFPGEPAGRVLHLFPHTCTVANSVCAVRAWSLCEPRAEVFLTTPLWGVGSMALSPMATTATASPYSRRKNRTGGVALGVGRHRTVYRLLTSE